MAAQCDAFAKSFWIDGKNPEVIINVRPRGASETRPLYQAALAAISSQVQSTEVSPCADQCEVVSAIDGRRLRQLTALPYAVRLMQIDDSIDAAEKGLGALPDVFIRSHANARHAREYHDERRFPGLDVLGYTTLRTFGGRPVSPGVYVNNPRLFSGPGSDYRYFQHTAIVNRVIETTFRLLEPKLSARVPLTDAGTIRGDVADAIEDSINAELRTRYSDPGRCSALRFRLSRTDDVLTTDTISFEVLVRPLGYAKKFIGKTGLARAIPATR